jgi:hypothetical protein
MRVCRDGERLDDDDDDDDDDESSSQRKTKSPPREWVVFKVVKIEKTEEQ